MYIVKVMKRKDAASVLVAVVLAMILQQLLFMPTMRLTTLISGIGDPNYNSMYGGGGPGWRNEYVNPVVSFVVQVLVLEILIRLFVLIHPLLVRKKK